MTSIAGSREDGDSPGPRRGIVVGHSEGALAGQRIIADGGNAVDGIVAAALISGVVALNAIGERGGPTLTSLHRTLREVFPHVAAFATNPDGPITNVVFFASPAPLALPDLFAGGYEDREVDDPGGELLTDQWNPINAWNAPWARSIRESHDRRY